MSRVAVVDLGTNSTRLLVADVSDGTVEEVERHSVVTRLGEGVDATGRLADSALERVHAAVAAYRERIDALAAESTVAVATSAVRDAENGEELRRGLRERFGIEARTIPGDEEARLTFLGATSGRELPGPVLVLDIGGGSTEFVIGTPGQAPEFRLSTPAGSVRQTERHVRSDPPRREELAALAREVHGIIEGRVPAERRSALAAGIAVAGTPTSLAAIDQELDPYDPARVHGYRLTREACELMLAMLAEIPLRQRRQVTGLHPDRAPTICAGTIILIEAMRAFDLGEIETSEADILHGCALEAAS